MNVVETEDLRVLSCNRRLGISQVKADAAEGAQRSMLKSHGRR